MKELEFYRCSICGNLLLTLNSSGVNPVCCGKRMELLVPNRTDADEEKHVPKVCHKHKKVEIKIGEKPHPMEENHHIEWITLQTDKNIYTHFLKDGSAEACFHVKEHETPLCVYAYCNIHGLWAKNLK